MTQARDAKKKTADPLERRKLEEHQPDKSSSQHSLLHLQRAAGNRAVVQLLQSHGHLQTKLRINGLHDEPDQEADRAADQGFHLIPSPNGVIQRKCAACSPVATCATCAEEEEAVQRKTKSATVFSSAGPVVQLKAMNSSVLSSITPHIQRAPNNGQSPNVTPDAAIEPATAVSGPLIVEDDVASVAPGQMRKNEFLEQLRSTVCTTADEALKEAGQSTEGCPYIEKWLDYYSEQAPAHIERALRKYAPEAAGATSAPDIISAVSNRVRVAVDRWATTGEITGVPPELAGMLPGAGGSLGAIGGMIGGALAGIGSAIGGAVSAAAGAVGSAFSSIGRALFKQKEGSAATNDPVEIQERLSAGQPLDGTAKSRMGAAFGMDFSGVRVHTDTQAAELSDKMSARAFTIGSDIAFSAGEYQPGTLIGDALIAHELAHVAQQQGGLHAAAEEPLGESQSLETEADDAAVEAILSVHLGDGSALRRNRSQLSSLKTGLRLQSCGGGPYSNTELQSYLEKLEKEGVQGGFYDDNRARGVVKQWKQSTQGFDLTPRLKYLLIEEMLDGSTGGDDERAILDLLELSDNGDLRMIFVKEGLSVTKLNKAIDGDNYKELLAFYEERFEGGRAALLQGRVVPKGSPRQGAPHFPYNWSLLENRLFQIPYLPEDIVGYVRSLSPDEQVQARRDLNDKRAAYEKRVGDLGKVIEDKVKAAAAAAGKTPADIDPREVALEESYAYRENDRKVRRIESVLNSLGLETAKRGVAAASAEAVVPTQAEKEGIKETVRPETPPTAAFTDPSGYESALRAAVKKLINDYHKAFVEDVSRTDLYPLERLAQIANAGRQAVNDAFGAQWGTGPEFEPNVNLIDLFVEVQEKVQSVPATARPAAMKVAARGELLKWMAKESVLRAVHQKFKASPEVDSHGAPVNDVARIQKSVADDIGDTEAERIIEILGGWPGMHSEGVVKLQTTKKPAGDQERRHFWKLYQTAIHEYIHSLMNGDYRTFAESFPGSKKSREYNTLVEGVATILHEMVWQSVQSKLRTKELRDVVEGPSYADKAFDEAVIPDIKQIRYGSYEEAQALIARVGITNVMLAFFKGRVDLIGG